MTTIATYVKTLRDAQFDIARKMGTSLDYLSAEQRVIMLSNLTIQAILIKRLVDKGVITNAELLSLLNAVRAADFPPEPSDSSGTWDTTPVTGI